MTSTDPREVAGYQIRARLGAGGMGRVYLALTRAGRPVAIKVVRAEFGDDEEFRDRFRQEVVAAQRVHGLYTAQVLDADPDARQPWLATAYVPGLSLQQAVHDHGPLPARSGFLLVAGIAEALQAIHAAGIVHRDLKPSNVILAADGPRVIDFGIAWAAAAPALTRSGIRVGSPPFMAPEQARGQPTTPTVDVFALGSLAAYAVAGRPPFGSDGVVPVLYRVLNEPPDLADCPPDLRPLIEHCLAKDPAQRPQPAEIIDGVRARMAGGSLAFGRSWLPAALSDAALSQGSGSAVPDGEWTFPPGEIGHTGASVPEEETFSGEVRGPLERSAAGALLTGVPRPDDPPWRGRLASAMPPVPGALGDGGPPAGGYPAGGQEALVAAGLPGPPGAGSSADGPPEGRSKVLRRTAIIGSAAVLLAAAAAAGVALLPSAVRPGTGHGRTLAAPHSFATPGHRPRVRPSGRPTGTRSGPPLASPLSGDPLPSSPAAGPRPGPAVPPSTAPPVTSPSTASSSGGQAAFAGTWTGTMSQPAWTVTSWTIELVIPASGRVGSYDAPDLGCSGTLILAATATTSMDAVARTTSAVATGCVHAARLTLTLSGSNGIYLTWTPVGHPLKGGTAQLTGS